MNFKLTNRSNSTEIGTKVQLIRKYFGVKQEALASELGISQQEYSKIEQQEDIEESTLSEIARALNVSPQVIKNFNVEKAIANINYSHTGNSNPEFENTRVINVDPINKIVELYERLLNSEREKIELLKSMMK